MTGPEGRYELACSRLSDDPWEGQIDVTMSGVKDNWGIEAAYDPCEGGEGICLMGLAQLDAWGDAFWFHLWPEANPPRIDYFGDRVLWRSDICAEAAPTL